MRRALRLVAVIALGAFLVLGAGYGSGLIAAPAIPNDTSVAANSSAPPAAPPASSPVGSRPPAGATASPVATPSAPAPSASPSGPTTAGPIPPPPPSANERTVRRLDAALAGLRGRQAIPGISATIIFPDGTTWSGVSGFAELATKTPMTPDTAFGAASMSKTFTAAAVLQLVEEGRLVLDERVAARLPGLGLDRRITVRMLLDHTSGLHDFFFDRRIDRALLGDRDAAWSAERSLRYVGKPYFKPGRGWHYSNTNYVLLGLLVEAVTGRSLAADVRTRFLDPLGLGGTWTQAAETARGPIAHGYRFATGARRAPAIDLADGTSVMPFRSVVTAAAGAGSIAAPSTDLARWARALYGGDVLRPETLAVMVDARPTRRFKPRVPYGLGSQAVSIDGRLGYGHSGRFLGSQGVMRWLPDERIAIVVLTNQSRRDPAIAARQLLRVVLGSPPKPQPAKPHPSPRAP